MIEVLQGYRHPLIAKPLLVQQDYAGYDPKSQDETEMREQDKGFGDRASRETREVLVDEMLGARQWRRSKLGYLTGIGTLSETIRGTGATIGGAGGRLATLARGVFPPRQRIVPLPTDSTDPSDRFVVASHVYGRSEGDIRKMQENTWRSFMLYFALMVGCLAIGIASLPHEIGGGLLPRYIDIVLRFAIVLPLAALTFRSGYVNWIVRRRSLASPGQYLASFEWFPERPVGDSNVAASTKTTGRRSRVAMVALLLLALAAIAVPRVGHAQTPPLPAGVTSEGGLVNPTDAFTTPSNDDLFLRLLSYVVPNVGPIPGLGGDTAIGGETAGAQTPAHTAIAKGFAVFSGLLLFIASAMLSWHVVAGIVASASEGQVLGQKWHQIWAPVRVTMGVGMLAPVAGGYCAAQILVLYLMVWGGSIANLVWVPYIEAVSAKPAASSAGGSTTDEKAASFAALPNLNLLVRDVLARELCYAAVGVYAQDIGRNIGKDLYPDLNLEAQEPSGVVAGFKKVGKNLMGAITGDTELFVNQIGMRYWDYGSVCGKISTDVIEEFSDPYNGMGPQTRAAVLFDQARVDAMTEMRQTLRPVAVDVATSYSRESPTVSPLTVGEATEVSTSEQQAAQERRAALIAAIVKAKDDYNRRMVTAASTFITEMDGGKNYIEKFSAEATRTGWATSGVFYMTLARMQGALYAKAAELPSIGAIDVTAFGGRNTAGAKYLTNDEQPKGIFDDYYSWWDDNIVQIAQGLDPNSSRAGRVKPDNEGQLAELLDSVFNFNVLDIALSSWTVDPLNPMPNMIDFGHTILNVFWSLVAMIAIGGMVAGGNPIGLIAGAVGFVSANTPLGKIFGVVTTVVTLLVLALLMVGVVHAYVLPMIPYIMVLFFILGMLVLVVEAMIAAPLWAFFHVRMDGQEFVDQVQRPGYMIAFNLMLRPVLMVLGLVMSFTVFGAMMWFLAETFHVAADAATSDNATGPIGLIVMMVILTYLHYQIAIRSFSLINQVPDRVMRWFGQGGENLGEMSDADKSSNFVVAQIGNRTEGLMKGAGLSHAVDNRASKPVGGSDKPGTTSGRKPGPGGGPAGEGGGTE